MILPTEEACSAYTVSIFMAGDISSATKICRDFCDKEGLCVTVTPTTYVYTGGEEEGFVVGLINYPRFPSTPGAIYATAKALAEELYWRLGQQSYTIQTRDAAFWTSYRTPTPEPRA